MACSFNLMKNLWTFSSCNSDLMEQECLVTIGARAGGGGRKVGAVNPLKKLKMSVFGQKIDAIWAKIDFLLDDYTYSRDEYHWRVHFNLTYSRFFHWKRQLGISRYYISQTMFHRIHVYYLILYLFSTINYFMFELMMLTKSGILLNLKITLVVSMLQCPIHFHSYNLRIL